MTKLAIEIYDASTGSEMTLTWRNKEEFDLAKAFLAKLGCRSVARSNPSNPEYYLLETAQQREELFAFRRKLNQGKT